ncbi:MAG: glycosyltransferase family 4 protein [Caldilineales bacterium]|nr:glycosyltransferase family 4 protein [Caldilineales bacterium]MCX7851884.1 glycosyltransferase family 4 protein [Caldilineales bacterium]
MRLLFDARTLQDHFPGIGRYVFNLLAALAPLWEGEIWALYCPDAANTRYDLGALARYPNLRPVPVAVPVFHLREQTDLPRLIRVMRPDLAHLPYYVRPFRPGVPNVLTLFDTIPRRFPSGYPRLRRWVIELMQRQAIRSADAYVAISQATASDFQTLYGIPAGRITITPLAADPVFRPQSPEAVTVLRRQWALDKPYVLYVGSHQAHKNLARLLEAWALLNPREVVLVIAGAGDRRHEALGRRVRALGLSSRVRMLPDFPAAALPALYGGAECFVFPSLYEGFGLPVLEAMACGTPVACSHTSSLPEVAGEAALFFDPTDPAAIAAALDRLLRDPVLRDALRRCGLAQAATFSWTRTAQTTIAAYRRLVAG